MHPRHYHHTGRTTRMLEEAASLASKGLHVIILVHCKEEAARLSRTTDTRHGNIRFATPEDVSFDFEAMRPTAPGYSMSTRFLVDPQAIQNRYPGLVDALHAYDPPLLDHGPLLAAAADQAGGRLELADKTMITGPLGVRFFRDESKRSTIVECFTT